MVFSHFNLLVFKVFGPNSLKHEAHTVEHVYFNPKTQPISPIQCWKLY